VVFGGRFEQSLLHLSVAELIRTAAVAADRDEKGSAKSAVKSGGVIKWLANWIVQGDFSFRRTGD
jgi:hypothetical protein